MPERSFSATPNGYRFGFQGQEGDNELAGEGNSWNYKYRMHDARLGRFFSVDPLSNQFTYNSPYAFSENRVIDGLELEGLEVFVINGTLGDGPLLNGEYSEQITKVHSDEGKTIAEIYNNSKVEIASWAGHNNSQARIDESETLFKTITAKHIEGEAITIVGHSHGGNVAILAAQKVYDYYKDQGIEVTINLVTLNTPYVVGGGYELTPEASVEINWNAIYTLDDKVVPQAGFNKTGKLDEGGDEWDWKGAPTGEYANPKDVQSGKEGSTSYQHPQACNNIEYKDKVSFIGGLFKKGGFKNAVNHRGWLPKNTKEWLPDLDAIVNPPK